MDQCQTKKLENPTSVGTQDARARPPADEEDNFLVRFVTWMGMAGLRSRLRSPVTRFAATGTQIRSLSIRWDYPFFLNSVDKSRE